MASAFVHVLTFSFYQMACYEANGLEGVKSWDLPQLSLFTPNILKNSNHGEESC